MNLRPYRTIRKLQKCIEAMQSALAASFKTSETALKLVVNLTELNAVKDARIAFLEKQLAVTDEVKSVATAKFLN